MRRSSKFAAVAVMFAGLIGTAPAVTDQSEPGKVGAIIARSKLTQATYAVYFWNRIEHPGQKPVEEWSAEFNSGSLHRVETPRDRIVANCNASAGTHLSLATGKIITGSQVAGVACGINTNRQFLKVETLGRVKSRFGDADRVRVTDAGNVRTYDISDDGIILRTIFQTNDAQHLTVLDVETVAVFNRLPNTAMFDEASLKESFVPNQFREAPK
jgi:hypothetical protein